MIWCNTHQRPHSLCAHLGGITMPCVPVDLTNVMEIDYIQACTPLCGCDDPSQCPAALARGT